MSSENDDNSEKTEKDGEKILNKIENEKEGICSFSVINKYYLLPFICPVFCMSTNVCIDLIEKTGSHNSLILELIIKCFSYILPGLLTFISSIREGVINNVYIYKKERNSSSVELTFEEN